LFLLRKSTIFFTAESLGSDIFYFLSLMEFRIANLSWKVQK